jgi:hypothetical protein
MNALDTAKLWAFIIAGAALVIALVVGGISIMYSRGHGGGEQIVGTLAKVIIGAAIVAAASGIAGIFLNAVSTNCTPIG